MMSLRRLNAPKAPYSNWLPCKEAKKGPFDTVHLVTVRGTYNRFFPYIEAMSWFFMAKDSCDSNILKIF